MMTTTTASTTSLVISEMEDSLASGWQQQPHLLLPSSCQVYRQGLVLAHVMDDQDNSNNKHVLQLYQTLLMGLPKSHLQQVLDELHQAFFETLQALDDDHPEHVSLAIQAMYGLYNESSATFLLDSAVGHAVAGWSMNKMMVLQEVYGKLQNYQHPNQHQLLALIAVFLQEPTLDSLESLWPVLHCLQERNDHDESASTSTTWEQLIHFKRNDTQWKEQWMNRVAGEPEQRDYLLSMFLAVEDHTSDQVAQQQQPTNTNTKPTTTSSRPAIVSPLETIQRLVYEVQMVFPSLGEGYIETALSYFQGNVERTVTALAEGTLPAVLQRLDPSLPARWKGPTPQQEDEAARQARRVTQEAVRAMELEAENEARALELVLTRDEYNDDYDDQYDEIDGFMSNDHGLYDDYDAIRTYNKLMKQEEEEQVFWAQNRNANRGQQKSSNDGSEEKSYRGPDKLKGGRRPRPDQSATKDTDNNNNDTNDTDATKEQGFMRGGGGGRGRGRGGHGGGRGRGGEAGGNSGGRTNNNQGTVTVSTASGGPGQGRGSARHKNNKLESRRNKQKQAAAKKSGA